MAKNKDYRDILKKILEDHPEIAAINVEYKKTERLTLGQSPVIEPSFLQSAQTPMIEKVDEYTGYQTPSGVRPIVPMVSPELIAKLKGQATVEEIPILNAPAEKK